MKHRLMMGMLLVGVTQSIPALAWAGDPAAEPSTGFLALRAFGSLAIVVGLLFLLAHFGKRFLGASKRTHSPAEGIVSRARYDLGNRREVRLLEVKGRLLVVGIAGDAMTLLADLDANEDVDSGVVPVEPTRRKAPRLGQAISSFLQNLTSSF